jgi:osmoprotectant transport system permease protein
MKPRQVVPFLVTVLIMLLSPGLVLDLRAADTVEVRIGSKKFTESVILGEILTHLTRSAGVNVTHRRELGGTRVLWNALRKGDIDAYPEYTGTIKREILAEHNLKNEKEIRHTLAEYGILMSRPLGFNNSYAIGMRSELAESLRIVTVSDLRLHPDLKLGFTNEFMDRGDGWPGLRDFYGLPHEDVRGLDHDLAYRGLAAGTIQVTDFYSTDAEIAYYGLRVLDDDQGFFPKYKAVVIYREDLAQRAAGIAPRILQLADRIDADRMITMNARAKIDKIAESIVAADFLTNELGITTASLEESWLTRLIKNTRDHLFLVGISLLGALLLAIPLGVLAARKARFGQAILGIAGIVQTIPSLALLVFMIPLLGIGAPPAIVALFLYSLLPILRNTHSGLRGIPPELRESAEALGLPPWTRLRRIELPLASPAILAGVKTSAVINVGTATLGALIGAGGYGQPILTGIRLDDGGLIFQGAIPAAVLALAMQGVFESAERIIVPRGLRLEPQN